MLIDVKNIVNNIIVADHLWFTRGKSWNSFYEGKKIDFDARVGIYEKYYKGHREEIFNPVSLYYRLMKKI